MSVTIRHLNADSSFLLIFSPESDPSPSDLRQVNGAYSVLVDPWLTGSSIINAKWFAVTKHVLPSSIRHLSDIEEPDVVLISQNKPDHCHKQTLLQLRSEGKTLIAAEPGAAKAIKSWNHFDHQRVHALTKYDAKAKFGNTLRLRIPPLGPEGVPGELNIAFIPAKNYVTGLHNAFGITYQPPTRVHAPASMITIDLPKRLSPYVAPKIPTHDPLPRVSPLMAHPPSMNVSIMDSQTQVHPSDPSQDTAALQRHRPQLSRATNTQSSDFLPMCRKPDTPASQEDLRSHADLFQDGSDIYFEIDALMDTTDFINIVPTSTPPLSSPSQSDTTYSPRPSDFSDMSPHPLNTSHHSSISIGLPYSPSLPDLQSRYSCAPVIHAARPKAISIIYTPHGIPLTDLQPYIQTHLVALPGALPLTCLLHSFSFASNPWWFGGNIMMGVDSGIAIARALMTRCWISAHDEVKEDKGVAVKLLKCDRHSAELVREKLASQGGGDSWFCDVRVLDVGAEVCLTSYTDVMQQQHKPVGTGIGLDMRDVRYGSRRNYT